MHAYGTCSQRRPTPRQGPRLSHKHQPHVSGSGAQNCLPHVCAPAVRLAANPERSHSHSHVRGGGGPPGSCANAIAGPPAPTLRPSTVHILPDARLRGRTPSIVCWRPAAAAAAGSSAHTSSAHSGGQSPSPTQTPPTASCAAVKQSSGTILFKSAQSSGRGEPGAARAGWGQPQARSLCLTQQLAVRMRDAPQSGCLQRPPSKICMGR